ALIHVIAWDRRQQESGAAQLSRQASGSRGRSPLPRAWIGQTGTSYRARLLSPARAIGRGVRLPVVLRLVVRIRGVVREPEVHVAVQQPAVPDPGQIPGRDLLVGH